MIENKDKIKVIFTDDKSHDKDAVYSVIVSRYKGRWVLCRHRERTTYEVPGGHIEAGETPYEAAKRELYEETGATEYDLERVCTYGVVRGGETNYGALFFADIKEKGKLSDKEIAEIFLFDKFPDNLTYPDIQPHMARHISNFLTRKEGGKNYRAAIFDLDGTLFDHFTASDKAAQSLYESQDEFKAKTYQHFKELHSNVIQKYFKMYKDDAITWEQQKIYRMKALYSHFGISLTEDEAFEKFQYYLSEYEKHWRLFDGARALLESIKARGLKLGLITNGDSVQQNQKLQLENIAELFDSIIISSNSEFAKPDPRIFEESLKELNLKNDEVFYVGDCLIADTRGANSAQIDSMHIIREHNKDRYFKEFIPVYIVLSLDEIDGVLDGY